MGAELNMNTSPALMRPSGRARTGRHRQEGIVLFIALIVLVAMSLAGIAMVRSVDTSLGIAGNMAFKQATIQGGDKGVAAAFTWLAANSAGTTLTNSDVINGYYSSAPVEATGYWFDDTNWTQAVSLNGGVPDAAGNTVRFVIHRMCTLPNLTYNGVSNGVTNECSLYYSNSTGTSGGSMSVGAPQFQGIPQLFYRITVRIDGPRNTISIIQVSTLFQV
jgi:type IV pilus assembly protein PilX